MKITIVGVGNAGTTVAADLTFKGHEVTLLKTSNSLHNENFNYIMNNGNIIKFEQDGEVRDAKISKITRDFKLALENSELIILYVQTNYQEDVIKRMSPYLTNQVILIEPGYLATLYFFKHCNCEHLTFAEAESSPLDCRIVKPGSVKVLFKNARNPVGIFPKIREESAMSLLSQLKYNFVKTENIVEAALHNPNLIVHTIGAFMSIPRIEHTNGKGYWMYKEVFTPSVCNLVKSLDAEKMQIMKSVGCKTTSYLEACKFRNSMDMKIDAEKVFFDYANNHSVQGPEVSDSRYITEDVPNGLVLLESLGTMLNIKTPICTSFINLSSAALNRDFRKEGRSIDKMGKKEFLSLIDNCGCCHQ